MGDREFPLRFPILPHPHLLPRIFYLPRPRGERIGKRPEGNCLAPGTIDNAFHFWLAPPFEEIEALEKEDKSVKVHECLHPLDDMKTSSRINASP